MTLLRAARPTFPPGQHPRFCAYEDRWDYMDNWNRIPPIVYGCPSARWVNHPSSNRLVRYDALSSHWRGVYDRKAGFAPTRTFIMRDSDPFISPVTGEYISGRAARRDHIREHDLVEAPDFYDDPDAPLTGYQEPSDGEMEEDIYIARQKLEQGYYDADPHRDDDDVFVTRQWREREEHLRAGGYQ